MTTKAERSCDRNPSLGSNESWADLPQLTRNQKMTYDALYALGRTAKAYELLDILRSHGVKAAPTVYRALHELEDKGLVQHIVSSRSFVALSAPRSTFSNDVTLVCENCGETRWVEDKTVVSALAENARETGFKVRACRIEFSTACDRCDPPQIQ